MHAEFRPDALALAVQQSRQLIPPAVDALCEVIKEATGEEPDQEEVRFVSSFWLMHLCDQVIHGGVPVSEQLVLSPERMSLGGVSRRSRLIAAFGSRTTSISVTDPYLKVSFRDECRAALRSRKSMQWNANQIPAKISSDLNAPARHAMCDRETSPNETLEYLRRLVALTAPVELVEQHHALSEWATTVVQPSQRLWYTANAHQGSIVFRHRMFAQRQHGSLLAIHQHGGGYGTDEIHLGEDHDIAVSDVFYTFGWQRPDFGRRVRPLPTAMPRGARGVAPQGYLLMSLPVTTNFYRFQAFLVPSHITQVVNETVAFVAELAAGTNIRVRSSGADVFPMERLSSSRAKVSQDLMGGSGSVAASRAKLVIHNYLATSWLETLAMNIPTVCFIPDGVHRFRAAAQPFADQLARVGILHSSGRDAAVFVNTLKGDPTSWWQSGEVQEAREQFVARYANFSENWLEAWQREFERVLDEGV